MPIRCAMRGLLFALVLPLVGCHLLETKKDEKEVPPSGAPVQAMVLWEPTVHFAPDTQHNGATIPVLAGRLYLFDDEVKYPMTCAGNLYVDLYDCSSEPPVLREKWCIDPERLKLYQNNKGLGWGYGMILPWSTYRPDMVKVQLKTRFEPLKGNPLFSDSGALALDHPAATPGQIGAAVAAKPKN